MLQNAKSIKLIKMYSKRCHKLLLHLNKSILKYTADSYWFENVRNRNIRYMRIYLKTIHCFSVKNNSLSKYRWYLILLGDMCTKFLYFWGRIHIRSSDFLLFHMYIFLYSYNFSLSHHCQPRGRARLIFPKKRRGLVPFAWLFFFTSISPRSNFSRRCTLPFTTISPRPPNIYEMRRPAPRRPPDGSSLRPLPFGVASTLKGHIRISSTLSDVYVS